MEPNTSKPTNRSPILGVLVILLVGATTGVGGYFLGRESENDSSSAAQANTEQEATTGVGEYCAQDWCINYDQSKWRVGEKRGPDELGHGGGIDLEYKTSSEVYAATKVQLAIDVDGRGGGCYPSVHKCYFKTLEVKPHPKVKGLYVVKVIDIMRDSGKRAYQATPSMYVVDDAEINKQKLQVGKEVEGHVVISGLIFDTGKKYPDTSKPRYAWLRFWPSKEHPLPSFETPKEAEDYLSPAKPAEYDNLDGDAAQVIDAQKVLESLHKKQ